MKPELRGLVRFFRKSPTTIPVIRMSGPIGAATPPRPGLSLQSMADTLTRAFSVRKAPAVAISINSPGGSPVQSTLIMRRIRALAEENDKTVLVFAEDVAASGGYLIALAGDEIFADPSSIVGSIGVVSGGFGFVEAIDKLGIERRVHTAGTRKAILDPFRPPVEEDVAHLKDMLSQLHTEFIDLVKSRRADKLADDDTLFSGLFWAGRKALDLGLIDGLGDLRGVLRERYGDDVVLKVMNRKPSFWRRTGIGMTGPGDLNGLGNDLVSSLEERFMWRRYGL